MAVQRPREMALHEMGWRSCHTASLFLHTGSQLSPTQGRFCTGFRSLSSFPCMDGVVVRRSESLIAGGLALGFRYGDGGRCVALVL